MTAKELVDYVLKHSYQLHPTYSQDEHKTWALGFIASIAAEKNHMDNVVWTRVKQRVEQLYDSERKDPAAVYIVTGPESNSQTPQ